MKVILNRYYDNYIYTKDIIGEFVFISFTKEFKYFGSIASYDLDGSIKFFWDSDHVDIRAKVHIYLAIPVNILN